jgi:hypothetical protein
MRLPQQSITSILSRGKGNKDKEGRSPVMLVKWGAIPPAVVEEANNNLGNLLTVVGVRDDALPGATYKLVVAQGLV